MKWSHQQRDVRFLGVCRAVLYHGWAFLLLCAATAAQAAPFAYITNEGSATVSVIDTATQTVVATVPVGSLPCGVAVTPDGALVYVANAGGDTVSVIDTATNTVVATVPVGSPIGTGPLAWP